MANFSSNPLVPEPVSVEPSTYRGISSVILNYNSQELGFLKSLILSLILHISLIVFSWLFLLILQFLGINLLTFDRPEKMKDIEFQLVTAPDEKPINPNTRNRAEHNSRSGGEKIPNVREAQPQQQAGNPQPKPRPQPQVAQAVTKPQPQRTQQQQKKVVTKQPDQPAPPKPRAKAPKPTVRNPRIAALPNPLAPVKVPDSSGPVVNTGPLVRNSTASSSSDSGSGSSSAAPATIPGQFSGGKPSTGGGPSGQGGQGSYSQYGSPGGGGGRPGIDAVAEPDFGPYLAELQRRIRRNWTPPEDREDKTVVLLFTISKDGRLLSINTKRSSGFANADSAAVMAVKMSAPFRPLPAEYRHNSINVEFTFDYNVYTGRSGGISRR